MSTGSLQNWRSCNIWVDNENVSSMSESAEDSVNWPQLVLSHTVGRDASFELPCKTTFSSKMHVLPCALYTVHTSTLCPPYGSKKVFFLTSELQCRKLLYITKDHSVRRIVCDNSQWLSSIPPGGLPSPSLEVSVLETGTSGMQSRYSTTQLQPYPKKLLLLALFCFKLFLHFHYRGAYYRWKSWSILSSHSGILLSYAGGDNSTTVTVASKLCIPLGEIPNWCPNHLVKGRHKWYQISKK